MVHECNSHSVLTESIILNSSSCPRSSSFPRSRSFPIVSGFSTCPCDPKIRVAVYAYMVYDAVISVTSSSRQEAIVSENMATRSCKLMKLY